MSAITGKVYVLGDNIDTDQIIPAIHLYLVPTIEAEYRKLGSFALSGLPAGLPPFVAPGSETSEYRIIVAGRNFGCGSSREHAPIALGAAGVKAVVAGSFARIFFRNCIATGELYPVDCVARLCDEFKTGDEADLRLDENVLIKAATGERFDLKPLGDAKDVIDAGGVFAYARKTGMIKAAGA